MRQATVTALIYATLLTASCKDATAPLRPPESSEPIAVETGRLIVRVVWDGQGVPGKRIEVLELHLTGTTDATGYATFDLRPGDYTLRAYDINRGGPAMLSIDTKVTVAAGTEVRIEVRDCRPCV